MAYIEISTEEISKIVNATENEKLSNIKSLPDGLSFDVIPGIKLLPKTIPLKVIFSEFDKKNETLIFKILLNSKSKILNKFLKIMLNKISSDQLPKGCYLQDNNFILSISELTQNIGVKIKDLNINLEAGTLKINFKIDDQ